MSARAVLSDVSDRRSSAIDWRRTILWGRLSELTAGFACALVAVLISALYHLTPVDIAHEWMLKIIPSETGWAVAFGIVGAALLFGATRPWGAARTACVALGIFFFSSLAISAVYAHSMPVATAFFIANACALSVTFVLGPRKGLA